MIPSKTPAAMPAQPRLLRIEGGGLRAWAPAKINLNLLVGERRLDGYHGIDSLVAKVTLYDRIDLRPRGDGLIRFSCAGADCGSDEQNLALKAARALAAAAPARLPSALRPPSGLSLRVEDGPEGSSPKSARASGVDIELHKSIPPGKGLGGGSSDAAAVLASLQELWDAPLPVGELRGLAAALGSDVPLFLGPPASRMTGRGEVLAPIEVHPFAAVLILPACECSTAAVYRAFDEHGGDPSWHGRLGHVSHGRPARGDVPTMPGRDPGDGGTTHGRDAHATKGPDLDWPREAPSRMGEQIDPGVLARPPSAWRGVLRNDLSAAARKVSPELAAVWDALSAAIAPPVCLTGSGSGFFVLCDDEAEALALLPTVRRACNSLHAEPGVGRYAECVVVRNNPW